MAKKVTTLHRAKEHDAEGVSGFVLFRPVDPALLDADLAEQMGWDEPAGITTDGNPYRASTADPVVLRVLRDDVDPEVLEALVAEHRINAPEDPLADLRAKAAEGGKFTPAEVQEVLRALLLRP